MTDAIQGFRGTVIKIPGNEPGLILANGKQWPFGMEGVWMSPVAPAANQTVEVTVDAEGRIASVSVVDVQQVAREKFNQFAGVAGDRGQQAAMVGKAKFFVLAGRMGYPLLIATVVLWVAWFFMTSLQINMGSYNLHSFSFFALTGISLSSGIASSHVGFWSLLGVLSIAAPWVAPWLRQRWAPLLHTAPLVFVVLTYLRYKWQIHSMVSEAVEQAKSMAGLLGGSNADAFEKTMKGIAEQTAARVAEAFSTGLGLWLVVLSALALAAMGFVRYRDQSSMPIRISMAAASMILGILGIALGVLGNPALKAFSILPLLLAIIFGHIARGRIRRAQPANSLGGGWMAMTGLVIGYVYLGFSLALMLALLLGL